MDEATEASLDEDNVADLPQALAEEDDIVVANSLNDPRKRAQKKMAEKDGDEMRLPREPVFSGASVATSRRRLVAAFLGTHANDVKLVFNREPIMQIVRRRRIADIPAANKNLERISEPTVVQQADRLPRLGDLAVVGNHCNDLLQPVRKLISLLHESIRGGSVAVNSNHLNTNLAMENNALFTPGIGELKRERGVRRELFEGERDDSHGRLCRVRRAPELKPMVTELEPARLATKTKDYKR